MMGRKPAPRPLALSETTLSDSDQRVHETVQTKSPEGSFVSTARSPTSPPSSPFISDSQPQTQAGLQPLQATDLVHSPPDELQNPQYTPSMTVGSPTFNPYDQQQQQQLQLQHAGRQNRYRQQQKALNQQSHGRYRQYEEKTSKSSFFRFGKSSAVKSTERLASNSYVSDARNETQPRGVNSPFVKPTSKHSDTANADHLVRKTTTSSGPANATQSDASFALVVSDADNTAGSGRKGKQKPFARLGRTRSTRDEDNNGSPHPLDSSTLGNGATSPRLQEATPMRVVEQPGAAVKTAPLTQYDRSFREMMSSSNRNHSADRANARDLSAHRDGHRNDRDQGRLPSASVRDNSGSAFLTGLKNSRAADVISRGLFGKSTRSGSTTERETAVDDEHYVLKVINRPLVEQTRMTRISKRLEESRDRTEFWMPAFPWRAIDYLNYKGTDVEGLYRVPGSGPQIKRWQRKFDEEYDVDLFAQEDLYDINIVGSMLKAWLRELPDELFPKEAQERIARECAGAETVPQMLVDELSNLSPFKYYLLFAITCHLSLLLAHSDKNKMDFRNLCICFQPCMKIDAFSFKFLVCDWRDCWKGCLNEPQYIEEEYRLFDVPPPRGLGTQRPQAKQDTDEGGDHKRTADETSFMKVVVDEHHIAPSVAAEEQDHIKPSSQSSDGSKAQVKRKNMATAAETGSVASNSTLSTTLTIESQQRIMTPTRQSGDLRPLSPIKPLSPLGF